MVGKSIGSTFAVGLFGNRSVGRYNSLKRNDLRVERDYAIAPHNELKVMIDEIIHQLDQHKFNLEASDQYKNKPKPEKSKRTHRRVPTKKPTLAEKPKRYLVNLGGDIKGPMTIEQIEGLLVAHIADRSTMLCVEGEIDWNTMEHFFEMPK